MIGLSNGANKASGSISDIGNLWVWGESNLALEQSSTSNIHTISYNGVNSTTTVYRSIKIENGKIVYSEPYTVKLSQSNASTLIGFYESLGDQTAYIIDSVYSTKSTYVEYNVYRIQISNYAGEVIQYLTSSESTAYPENDRQGNYWYTRLGQIGKGMTRIETGSYVGTGTYGSSNPNSLTFGFAPKLFSIYGALDSSFPYGLWGMYDGNNYNHIIPFDILSTSYTKGFAPSVSDDTIESVYAKKSVDGKTVSWYGPSNSAQNNVSAVRYFYFAIG